MGGFIIHQEEGGIIPRQVYIASATTLLKDWLVALCKITSQPTPTVTKVSAAMKPSLPTTLTLLAQLAHAADKNAWKSRSIYFALTDRIARSSNDNGGDPCGNLGDYCGGTFQGLEGKLDYIRGMGFDAIWITPVVASTQGQRPRRNPCHQIDY